MSDHFISAQARAVLDAQPFAAALETWIRAAPTQAAREARTVEALAVMDRIGKFIAFETLTLEAADPNGVGLFDRAHRARRDRHPSSGQPSAEARALAVEEYRHDRDRGEYA